MTATERAIAYIEDCRESYVSWIKWQDEGLLSREDLRIGGGKTHHKLWVRRYDHVLRVLRDVA